MLVEVREERKEEHIRVPDRSSGTFVDRELAGATLPHRSVLHHKWRDEVNRASGPTSIHHRYPTWLILTLPPLLLAYVALPSDSLLSGLTPSNPFL